MANLTASIIDSLLNLKGSPEASVVEMWIDQAINLLNLYGNLDISNMSGTAGSKTVGLESREKGAVVEICRRIYYSYYKKLDAAVMAGVSITSVDLMSNTALNETIKQMARELSELDVSRG